LGPSKEFRASSIVALSCETVALFVNYMSLITILILGWFAQQTAIASIAVVQIGTAQPIAKAIVELSGGGRSRNAASGSRIRVSELSRENIELLAIPFAY
jgi:parvulin-like peptidyl-prolyl isomerase